MNLWEVPADDEDEKTWVAATAEWIGPCPRRADGARPHPGSRRAGAGAASTGPSGKRFALDRPELRWLIIRRVLRAHRRQAPDPALDGRPPPRRADHVRGAARPAPRRAAARAHGRGDGAQRGGRDRPERGRAASTRPSRPSAASGSTSRRSRRRRPTRCSARRCRSTTRRSSRRPRAARATRSSRSSSSTRGRWAGTCSCATAATGCPKESLEVRAATTAELWDERLRALPEALRRARSPPRRSAATSASTSSGPSSTRSASTRTRPSSR